MKKQYDICKSLSAFKNYYLVYRNEFLNLKMFFFNKIIIILQLL